MTAAIGLSRYHALPYTIRLVVLWPRTLVPSSSDTHPSGARHDIEDILTNGHETGRMSTRTEIAFDAAQDIPGRSSIVDTSKA